MTIDELRATYANMNEDEEASSEGDESAGGE